MRPPRRCARPSPRSPGAWARDLELLLAERERRLARRRQRVALPIRVPASRFKDYVDDPAAVAASLRRPMPEQPVPGDAARHPVPLLGREALRRCGGGSDELDADADRARRREATSSTPRRSPRLQATFEALAVGEPPPGRGRARDPPAVRRPHRHLQDRRRLPATGDRFEVVDWKTGKAPADAADLERKQLQLALYRLAYAKWSGIDPELIDAAFYFVADDLVIRPPHIDSEAELLARWRAVFEPSSRHALRLKA